MTDSHTMDAGTVPHPSPRPPFPLTRFFYALGYAVLAWLAFWILLILAFVQFVVVLVTGRVNSELRNFNLGLLQYLTELIAFISFARDDRPFPFGPFPKPGQ
jgi:Domain of unknown function (DUF4389)